MSMDSCWLSGTQVERRHHLRGEAVGKRRSQLVLEERIAQLEELSAQLQEQNLGFIKTFEEQLEWGSKG